MCYKFTQKFISLGIFYIFQYLSFFLCVISDTKIGPKFKLHLNPTTFLHDYMYIYWRKCSYKKLIRLSHGLSN